MPTTYLIDREGKILSAWVGFSEDDENAKAALKKLGLESEEKGKEEDKNEDKAKDKNKAEDDA